FLAENNLLIRMKEIMNKVWFLRQTWLFGEKTTFISLGQVAQAVELVSVSAGEKIVKESIPTLWLVVGGEVELTRNSDGLVAIPIVGRLTIWEAAIAKLFTSEAAWRAADRCVQIHGGYGYSREFPAERYLRDSRILTIFEGTSEVQRLLIGRLATGHDAFRG
ncbi:hypothetical protein IIA16_03000, partial [bacterium]|nr:hypothetical protein [bacterium]